MVTARTPRQRKPTAIGKAPARKKPLAPPGEVRVLPRQINGHTKPATVQNWPPDAGISSTFFIRDKSGLVRIDVNEILYIQAELNYVEIMMVAQRHVLRTSLNEIMARLPEELFQRINRAAAVNIMHVERVQRTSITVAGHSLAISRGMREDLFKRLHIVSGR